MLKVAAQPGDQCGDVLALLLHEVRALRDDLAALRADLTGRRGLSSADRAALARLLPAMAAAFGDTYTWTARELLAHAERADPALLAAIAEATGPLDHRSAQRLGRLLRRARDIEIGGLTVERVGDDRDGAVLVLRQRDGAKPAPLIAPAPNAA